MEPRQHLMMWLATGETDETEEDNPWRLFGAVLVEIRDCEKELRNPDITHDRRSYLKKWVKKVVLYHIMDSDPEVERARIRRLRTACEDQNYKRVLEIIELL